MGWRGSLFESIGWSRKRESWIESGGRSKKEKGGEEDEDAGWNGRGWRKGGNKRAPLSKYFYDVAAFRGSLVKKGFPFVGRDTIAKCSTIPVCAPLAELLEPTTLLFIYQIYIHPPPLKMSFSPLWKRDNRPLMIEYK